MNIRTIANQLNKDDEYVMALCDKYGITVDCDKEGCCIPDVDGRRLLQEETQTPTRYNKRGLECVELQKIYCGNNNVQYSYLANVLKYLYRRGNVGDLKKASTYLNMWIKDIEEGANIID